MSPPPTPAGTEYASGHLVVRRAAGSRRSARARPRDLPGAERIDGRGLLVTPGLVNVHHHLYQWITRGYAIDDTLFDWLTTLYPVWARLDAELVHDSAAANLAWMALTGITTSTDHHYVFPTGAGDLLEAEITAAQRDRAAVPPDPRLDEPRRVGRWPAAGRGRRGPRRDPRRHRGRPSPAGTTRPPSAMVRIAVAPCSPFSVTAELMRDSAALARRAGVRLHTHLAETVDEEEFCRATFGATPAEYAEDLGWLGEDVLC